MNDINHAATPSTAVPFNHRPYAIAQDATSLELTDKLATRLIQLDAMLILTYGEAGEMLRDGSGELHGNYMWACSDLARECRELFTQLESRRTA